MSGRINGPLNNQHVPFSNVQHNAEDYALRRIRALDPIDSYDDGGCCGSLFACMGDLFRRIWEAVKEILLACCPCFDERNLEPRHFVRGGVEDPDLDLPLEEAQAPVRATAVAVEGGLKPLTKEILDYADNWAKRSFGEQLTKIYPKKNHEDAIKKYVAFVHLRRFEYSDYPAEYRDHYFHQLTERAKLLTMELLKLEQDALANPNAGEREVIIQRMREALREIADAAATGCDPRKATVTFVQWKNISGRVEIYQILLQHIQDAKMSIFTKRVPGLDQNLWGVHAYNWIYANFGEAFGLCSKTRAEAAKKDGYTRSDAVTSMVKELESLKPEGAMQFKFREEFTEEYLFNWVLNAINMDEYPAPYMNALQAHCQEVVEDPKQWNQYVEVLKGKKSHVTSYLFKPKAVDFFLKSKDKNLDLAIDWRDEFAFESFIHDRLPASIEDGIRQKDLDEVNLAHLLRLWRAYMR